MRFWPAACSRTPSWAFGPTAYDRAVKPARCGSPSFPSRATSRPTSRPGAARHRIPIRRPSGHFGGPKPAGAGAHPQNPNHFPVPCDPARVRRRRPWHLAAAPAGPPAAPWPAPAEPPFSSLSLSSPFFSLQWRRRSEQSSPGKEASQPPPAALAVARTQACRHRASDRRVSFFFLVFLFLAHRKAAALGRRTRCWCRRGPSRWRAHPPECGRVAVEGLLVGSFPRTGEARGGALPRKLWLGRGFSLAAEQSTLVRCGGRRLWGKKQASLFPDLLCC